MSEVTIKFVLPDDENEFTLATNAGRYHSALSGIQDRVYRIRKYEMDEADTKEDYIKIIESFIDLVNEEVFDCRMLS
jgi:hypothetical protein